MPHQIITIPNEQNNGSINASPIAHIPDSAVPPAPNVSLYKYTNFTILWFICVDLVVAVTFRYRFVIMMLNGNNLSTHLFALRECVRACACAGVLCIFSVFTFGFSCD